MSILVDTNLLVRSLQPDSSQYRAASTAILELKRNERLCIGDRERLEAEPLPHADESDSVVMDAADVRRMRDGVRRRIEQRADR
jgi:hypothetical protein